MESCLTMVNGPKTCSMEWEHYNLKMDHCIKFLLLRVKNLDMEFIHGKINQYIKGTSYKTIWKVKANLNGQMVGSIKVNGKRTSSMVTECINYMMEESMEDIGRIIKDLVTEFKFGQMEDNTMENGKINKNIKFTKNGMMI